MNSVDKMQVSRYKYEFRRRREKKTTTNSQIYNELHKKKRREQITTLFHELGRIPRKRDDREEDQSRIHK
jgi:hypothetical protein